MNEDSTKALSKVIRIDESEIQSHLDKMVRGTVEDALNAMLDAEADEMCNAQRYERSPDRVDTQAGHYTRKLHTKAGEVEVKKKVGSRTGAVVRREALVSIGGFPLRAQVVLTVIPFPVPATSHAACGFPALRAPAQFTTTFMRPIEPEQLSAPVDCMKHDSH